MGLFLTVHDSCQEFASSRDMILSVADSFCDFMILKIPGTFPRVYKFCKGQCMGVGVFECSEGVIVCCLLFVVDCALLSRVKKKQ